MFTKFSERVAALTGWRALFACFLSGALMALGFAPFYFWPVIFISLPVFYVLLNPQMSYRRMPVSAQTPAPAGVTPIGLKQTIFRGFFFGYGYFMAGTWWIANALLVDVSKFGWMIPFSVLGLSALLAAWFALFGFLWHRKRTQTFYPSILRFVFFWLVIEYLRSLGIFGFPWNLIGYMTLASLPVAQGASLIGTYGMGVLVVLVGLSPLLIHRHRAWLLMPIVMIGGFYAYGAHRIPPSTAMTGTHLRVVQANISQKEKWTEEGEIASLNINAELTRAPGQQPDVIVWPESAFPYTLKEGSMWPLRLAQLLPPRAVLLTGAVTAKEEGGKLRVWNSLVAIDALGEMRESYGKHQLVPFGEFVPLRDMLPLDKITPGDLDFSRGEGPRTISIDSIPPFSPLVCYEAIFPSIAVNKHNRPAWMVNVTNDGWYGNSPGPYQHFDMARMRAVEQGLPLVRAANTGISAVIDPYGRVTALLALGERGVINTTLPAALPPTIYARLRGE